MTKKRFQQVGITGGFLLGLPAAEVGGVLVACGGRGIAGSEGDAELSLGRILDGGY